MALDTFYKVQFSDAVDQLAGSQKRSLLREFTRPGSKKGEAVFFDGISPDTAARATAIASVKNRATFEDLEGDSQTFANWQDIQTPHMEVNRQRTYCAPTRIDWGHSFSKEKDLQEITSEHGQVLQQGMRSIWFQEDTAILTALFAANQSRGKNQANLSSVSFPNDQKMTLTTVTKAMCSEIKAKFENQYEFDDMPVCCISPTIKKLLIDHSGGTIHSADFVSKHGLFEKGELPDIYGVRFCVHPLVDSYAADGMEYAAVAWDPRALIANEFEALSKDLDRNPGLRFQVQAYLEEFLGCCRTDDNLVVQIQFNTDGSGS